MITVVLGVAVCTSVLAKTLSAARWSRSFQKLGGFLGHMALSAVVVGVGASVVLVPSLWSWLFERLVVGYAFFLTGGR